MRKTVKTLGAVVACLVASASLAACGGDTGAEVNTGGLTGDPIKLGSVLTITNPIWDNSGTRDVNVAFASYINDTLGGIDGRPVEVITCDDHGDPAKTTQCYNNLVDDGVVGFVNNSSLAFGANALPALEKAGFAAVGGWPVAPDEFASKSEFLTTPGASGSYPALAVYFRSQGAKNLAMMFANTPAGQTAADNVGNLWTSIGGTSFTGVEYDPTAADFTPNAAKVGKANPDAVIFATGEGTAPRLFQAVDLAGVDALRGATSTAATKSALASAGEAAHGMVFSFAAVPPDFDSEDAATYREVMKKYAPSTELTNQTGAAASSMMYAYHVISELGSDITKESVLAAFQGTSTWKGFLTHSTDTSLAPEALPAVSNPYNLVAKYTGEGFEAETVADAGELAPYLSDEGGLTWISGSPKG